MRIIEDSKWLSEDAEQEEKAGHQEKKILIPIDFSDYSIKACELGINYAHKVGAEVMIMHAYFSPYFPSAIPMGDTLAYQVNEEETAAKCPEACPDRYGKHLYIDQPQDTLW